MRYLLPALATLALLPAAAHAQYQTRCSTDSFGNTRCTDSSGAILNIRSDPYTGTTRSTYYGPSGPTTCTTRSQNWGLDGIRTTTNCY